jgi:hypothetical protein
MEQVNQELKEEITGDRFWLINDDWTRMTGCN